MFFYIWAIAFLAMDLLLGASSLLQQRNTSTARPGRGFMWVSTAKCLCPLVSCNDFSLSGPSLLEESRFPPGSLPPAKPLEEQRSSSYSAAASASIFKPPEDKPVRGMEAQL